MSVLGSSDEACDLECTCSLCIKEVKHRQAKTFYQECDANLCASCADTHGRFPALRNHTTVMIKDSKKICGLRNADEKKEAKWFCTNCDP